MSFRQSLGVIAICTVVFQTAVARQAEPSFASIITAADAVVVVEILSADYSAVPADGPMTAEAKVLKSLRGPLRKDERFRFSETAWVGPNYRRGEQRVVFLEFARTNWRILGNLYARADFFIESDAIPRLTEASLKSFLETLRPLASTRIVINRNNLN